MLLVIPISSCLAFALIIFVIIGIYEYIILTDVLFTQHLMVINQSILSKGEVIAVKEKRKWKRLFLYRR